MTPQAIARDMRRRGKTYGEIAEALGIGLSTAFRWLNPERVAPYLNGRTLNPERARASDRQYGRAHRATCTACGGKMGIGSRRDGTCAECWADRRLQRWERIRDLWEDGASMAEIAAVIGTSRNAVGTAMAAMRHAGWKLSYRRAGWTNRIAA